MSVFSEINRRLPGGPRGREVPLPGQRQNLLFKIVSLAAAIALYLYVQGERNPQLSRILFAQVEYANLPESLEVDGERRVSVTVTGPRAFVERMKDGDVRAAADFANIKPDPTRTQPVALTFRVPNLPPDTRLLYDPPGRTLRMTIYQPQVRQLSVDVSYPQEPAAGYEYGRTDIKPGRVRVQGRLESLRRVDHLTANATPSEQGSSIDGEFEVVARDRAGTPVDGITLTPDKVKIAIPLIPRPPVKIVHISPDVTDLPLPPYRLEAITVSPRQVRVIGRPERLNQIGTISTEEISVRDLTDNREVNANLIIPVDVTVRDMDNNPVTAVKVRLTVRRASPTAPPVNPSGVPDNANSKENKL